jgi:protein-L-isoaspartate(D-aspartate) O-methyltransferase
MRPNKSLKKGRKSQINRRTKSQINRRTPKVFKSNNDLVDNLVAKRIISDERVIQVMKKIDRRHFLHKNDYYLIDKPNRLFLNQTISAPHIHGKALEYLIKNCSPGKRVLDVGCGSGYLTACFCELLKVNENANSRVVGIDIYSGLVDYSIKKMKDYYPQYLPKFFGGTNKNNNVKIICANGWKGWKEYPEYKYDVIHVGASPEYVPKQLLNQLNNGGLMIIPVGNSYTLITKNEEGKINKESILNVRFVPLIKNTTDCIIKYKNNK